MLVPRRDSPALPHPSFLSPPSRNAASTVSAPRGCHSLGLHELTAPGDWEHGVPETLAQHQRALPGEPIQGTSANPRRAPEFRIAPMSCLISAMEKLSPIFRSYYLAAASERVVTPLDCPLAHLTFGRLQPDVFLNGLAFSRWSRLRWWRAKRTLGQPDAEGRARVSLFAFDISLQQRKLTDT